MPDMPYGLQGTNGQRVHTVMWLNAPAALIFSLSPQAARTRGEGRGRNADSPIGPHEAKKT